jgi:RHS repeat-associated protein
VFVSAASNLIPRSTGKERDAETGLDYFLARYYSGAQGRFISPDPGPYDLKNPQSLNRYTYVMNNPLKFVDPSGEMVEYVFDPEKKTITIKVNIELYGPDASSELASRLDSEIEAAWQGKYTDPETGIEYDVTTSATVTVADKNELSGSPVPNQIYVDFSQKEISNFNSDVNKGNKSFPRYIGAFYEGCKNSNCRKHETGHVIGLGDDYYADTGEAVLGHEGHLMGSGGNPKRADQDEINRFAGYVVNTGKSKGTVVWLPGSKSAYGRMAERLNK